MKNAVEGYNFEEAKEIILMLVLFHGTCAKLKEMEPNIFENWKYGLLK